MSADHVPLDDAPRRPESPDPSLTLADHVRCVSMQPVVMLSSSSSAAASTASVAIRHIRQIKGSEELPSTDRELVVPASARTGDSGIVTREMSVQELARELELARLLDLAHRADPDEPAPEDDLEDPTERALLRQLSERTTKEIALKDIAPAAYELLMASPEPRVQAHQVAHFDANPTRIAEGSGSHPRVEPGARALESERPKPRYQPPAPSISPEAQPGARTGLKGVLFACGLAAGLALGISAYTSHSAQPFVPALLRAEPVRAGAGPRDVTQGAAASDIKISASTQQDRDALALFARPDHAAELYSAGRFKEALAEYRMLAALHPEQPAYADFARALQQRLVSACVRSHPQQTTECSQL